MHHEFGELDLIAPETHDDPWELYTWLREDARIYQDCNGIWAVSRYEDIVTVSKDPSTYTSTEGNRPLLPADESFIHLDGAEHRARRNLVADRLCSHAVRAMEGKVRASVNRLIDDVIERGGCDYIEEIAAPLPASIIMTMTGIPDEMQETVRHLLDSFARGGNGPEHVTEDVNDAYFSFGLMHMDLVEERKACPRNDLLSLWIEQGLTEDQLLWEHTMMLIGGSETARNAIAGGVVALAQHPDQRQYLIDNPDGIPNAVEEIIRWTTPFVSMSRTVTRDHTFLGQELKEGDPIMMLYPPANRDPRVFVDPETFDVRRSFKKSQIAFGFGRHFCIGAHLARLEAKVMFEELLKRIPDWELAAEPVWNQSSFIRGALSVPLSFTPGARAQREEAA